MPLDLQGGFGLGGMEEALTRLTRQRFLEDQAKIQHEEELARQAENARQFNTMMPLRERGTVVDERQVGVNERGVTVDEQTLAEKAAQAKRDAEAAAAADTEFQQSLGTLPPEAQNVARLNKSAGRNVIDLGDLRPPTPQQPQRPFEITFSEGGRNKIGLVDTSGNVIRSFDAPPPQQRELVPIVVQGPQGPVIVDRASGTSRDVTAPSGGGQLGRPVNQVTAEKVAGMEQSLSVLDDLEKLRDDSWLGPVAGRAMEMSLSIPGVPVDEKFAKFAAQTSTLKNSIVKAITGAQMSEPEAKRIMGQVPSLTDKPSVWIQKAVATRENLRLLRDRTLQLTGASRGVSESTTPAATPAAPEFDYVPGKGLVRRGGD